MSKDFKPFTLPQEAPAGAARSFARIVVDPALAKPFLPITESGGAVASLVKGEPKVTIERDGDRVTAIRIQCCCGHTIELACEY